MLSKTALVMLFTHCQCYKIMNVPNRDRASTCTLINYELILSVFVSLVLLDLQSTVFKE